METSTAWRTRARGGTLVSVGTSRPWAAAGAAQSRPTHRTGNQRRGMGHPFRWGRRMARRSGRGPERSGRRGAGVRIAAPLCNSKSGRHGRRLDREAVGLLRDTPELASRERQRPELLPPVADAPGSPHKGGSMSRRWLVPLCCASVLWAFSFGVSAALSPLWMQRAGCGDALVGRNTGCYYLGIAVTAAVVPWLMRRLGSAALLLGMLASAVTVAAFPLGGGVFGWFWLRGLNGVAAAVSLIPLETCVNCYSEPRRRAENFGYYAFCIALGMALGELVGLQMAPTAPGTAFLLGGAAALLAAVVIPLWRPVLPDQTRHEKDRTPLHFVRNALPFGSGWSQGFLEGGMVALLPIYLLSTGLPHDAVGWLMGGIMVGVILAQAPLAWLADRLGRMAVLAGCNVVALLGVGCLMWGGGVAW